MLCLSLDVSDQEVCTSQVNSFKALLRLRMSWCLEMNTFCFCAFVLLAIEDGRRNHPKVLEFS